MKLQHRAIPPEFLARLPEGIKYIQQHGNGFLVVETLSCPGGHSLISESVRIHGEPSIEIAVELPSGTGHIYVDAFWGSHAKLYDFMPESLSDIESAQAICPTCNVSLIGEGPCGAEGCSSSNRIVFQLPNPGDRITACARLGCPDHVIVAGGLPTKLSQQISEINFFGYGEDEQFHGI